jgi:hypothetical protein
MKQSILLLAIAAALFALPAVSVAEMVTAYFEGDPTDPTVVDTYPGIGGEGWTAGWATKVGSSGTFTGARVNTTPLATGTGYYLNGRAKSSSTSGSGATVYRNYGGLVDGVPAVDMTVDHMIKFLFRIDENLGTGSTFFTSNADRYQLCGETGTVSVGSSATTAWYLGLYGADMTAGGASGNAGKWIFHDFVWNGSTSTETIRNSNITVAAGTTYAFTLKMHPATFTWDATVTDGTNTFTQTGMGFRARAALSGWIQFTGRGTNSSDTRQFSLDSIEIPEPSTLVMALGAALAALGLGRRR